MYKCSLGAGIHVHKPIFLKRKNKKELERSTALMTQLLTRLGSLNWLRERWIERGQSE